MAEELLISTKDRPGEYDALETAKPDEPIFVLQGGDPFSPGSIEHWAQLCRAAALLEENPEKREAMLRKATAAEQVAWAFAEYQRGEETAGRVPASQDASQGLDGSERQAILARGADRLYNTTAEAVNVADALDRLGEFSLAAAQIRGAADLLNQAAAAFEPRRHLRKAQADG